MLNFRNEEELANYMFKKANKHELCSVIACKDLSVSVFRNLLKYDNVIILDTEISNYQCNKESVFQYDKEYIVTLHNVTDDREYHVIIEQIYDYEKNKYLGTDGYVLFHEDVNSKALIDMQNNELLHIDDYDDFVIRDECDEEEYDTVCCVNDDCEENNIKNESIVHYTINGKEVGKDTYEAKIKEINKKFGNRWKILFGNMLFYI